VEQVQVTVEGSRRELLLALASQVAVELAGVDRGQLQAAELGDQVPLDDRRVALRRRALEVLGRRVRVEPLAGERLEADWLQLPPALPPHVDAPAVELLRGALPIPSLELGAERLTDAPAVRVAVADRPGDAPLTGVGNDAAAVAPSHARHRLP